MQSPFLGARNSLPLPTQLLYSSLTAPLQHGKSRLKPEGVCISTCISDLSERSRTPFCFLFQRNTAFPSKTTGVQVSCLCRHEVFLPALGRRVTCRLKEPCSPQSMQSLTLPGACSSTGHFLVGTQQGPDQPR